MEPSCPFIATPIKTVKFGRIIISNQYYKEGNNLLVYKQPDLEGDVEVLRIYDMDTYEIKYEFKGSYFGAFQVDSNRVIH